MTREYRNVRLPAAVMDRLRIIARREELKHGSRYSAAQAVAWLAERDTKPKTRPLPQVYDTLTGA